MFPLGSIQVTLSTKLILYCVLHKYQVAIGPLFTNKYISAEMAEVNAAPRIGFVSLPFDVHIDVVKL